MVPQRAEPGLGDDAYFSVSSASSCRDDDGSDHQLSSHSNNNSYSDDSDSNSSSPVVSSVPLQAPRRSVDACASGIRDFSPQTAQPLRSMSTAPRSSDCFCALFFSFFLFWWGIVIGAGMIQHGGLVGKVWHDQMAERIKFQCKILDFGITREDFGSCASDCTDTVIAIRVSVDDFPDEEFIGLIPECELVPWPNDRLSAEGGSYSVGDRLCDISRVWDVSAANCLSTTIENIIGRYVDCYADPISSISGTSAKVHWSEYDVEQVGRNVFASKRLSYSYSWPSREDYFFLWITGQFCGEEINTRDSTEFRTDETISDQQSAALAYRTGGILVLVSFVLLIVLPPLILTFTNLGKGYRRYRRKFCVSDL